MSTGDPMWPCGCIDYSMGALVKPEKCPKCFPIERNTWMEQSTAAHNHYAQISKQIDVKLDKLRKDFNVAAVHVHDEILFTVPEERRAEFLHSWSELFIEEKMKEISKEMKVWLEDPEALKNLTNGVDHVFSEWSEPLTGKFDTKEPNRAGQIPRREKGALFSSLYGGTLTGRMSCKEPNISAKPKSQPLADIKPDKHFYTEVLGQFIKPEEEDKKFYPMSRSVAKSTQLGDRVFKAMRDTGPDGFKAKFIDDPTHPLLLQQYQTAQRFGDRASVGRKSSRNGKAFLLEHPEASDVWSAALRSKVLDSEEADRKEKDNVSIPWDPYGDWED